MCFICIFHYTEKYLLCNIYIQINRKRSVLWLFEFIFSNEFLINNFHIVLCKGILVFLFKILRLKVKEWIRIKVRPICLWLRYTQVIISKTKKSLLCSSTKFFLSNSHIHFADFLKCCFSNSTREHEQIFQQILVWLLSILFDFCI